MPREHAPVRRDLGEGLVVRWSTAADEDRIVELFSHVFRQKPDEPPNPFVSAYIRQQMSGAHPLGGAGEIALAEDTRSGAVVSASALLCQTWEYAGIEFTLGRPEPVATHEDYRGRGLVRACFDLMHARSAERGDLAQAITGIPYFYRQFGYEYALDLGGARTVYFAAVPQLKEGETEAFALREATADDLSQVQMLYERERTRTHGGLPLLVSARVERPYWRWTLDGQSDAAGEGWRTYMIDDRDSRTVGYVLVRRVRWQAEAVGVLGLMVEPGTPMTAVMPSVLRAIRTLGPQLPLGYSQPGEPNRIALVLGAAHPAYDALGPLVAVRPMPPYGWYVRVPDLPAMLRRIAPALERRLASSTLSGYSGDLRLDFYRGGLRLAFERGRLTAAEEWQRPIWGDEAGAGFPPLVFLQLLFGRRSLGWLREHYDDVWANDEPALLLETLFPQQLSWVMPLD